MAPNLKMMDKESSLHTWNDQIPKGLACSRRLRISIVECTARTSAQSDETRHPNSKRISPARLMEYLVAVSFEGMGSCVYVQIAHPASSERLASALMLRDC